MRTLAMVVCCVMSFGVVSSPAVAQQIRGPNAANWYRRAMEQYQRTITPQQQEAVAEYLQNPSGAPPQAVRDALANSAAIFSLLRRGSTQDLCDFGLDRSAGFEMLLPHLSPMRSLAKLMTVDALVAAHDGNSAAAAQRMGDVYRMSGHVAQDNVLISSLVGQSMFTVVDHAVQAGIDRGAFSAAESATLLASVKRLSSSDPFEFSEALAGEQELAVNYLEDNFADPESRDRLLTMMYGGTPPEGLEADAVRAMTPEQFQGAVDEYDSVMGRVVEAFALPPEQADQAQAALDQLSKELEMGLHGPFVSIVMPSFTRAFQLRLKAQQMVADRIKVLEGLASGQQTIRDTANAAEWYLRGVRELEELPPGDLKVIREHATNPAAPQSESVLATLAKVQQTLDVFRAGSTMRRCDFSASKRPMLMLFQSYSPGMHDALLLLEDDARRLLNANDVNAAVDRLAIGLRMVGHLGDDSEFASTITAHVHFAVLIGMIRDAREQLLQEPHKGYFAEALGWISRKDPFGYVGSTIRARHLLAQQARNFARADDDADARDAIERSIEHINSFAGDQLLALAAVFDTVAHAQPDSVSRTSPTTQPAVEGDSAAHQQNLERLTMVYSREGLEAARLQTPRMAPMLASNRWDVFSEGAVPQIALPRSIGEQMRRARADLRIAMSLLEPPLKTSDAKAQTGRHDLPSTTDR